MLHDSIILFLYLLPCRTKAYQSRKIRDSAARKDAEAEKQAIVPHGRTPEQKNTR